MSTVAEPCHDVVSPEHMQFINETTGASPTCAVDEETVNTATHGVALVLSLLGAAAIFVTAPRLADVGLAVSCAVYAMTLVAVYAVSTLSHAVERPRARHLLRAWDQGVIYLLIAGTYTPFVWAYLSSGLRWVMLAAIWGAALVGFYSKVVAQHRVNTLTTLSYVVLGWVPALAMVTSVPPACLIWMAAGGLLYTAGTFFLKMDGRFRYFHATWHVFVVLASACHYYSVLAFIVLRGGTV